MFDNRLGSLKEFCYNFASGRTAFIFNAHEKGVAIVICYSRRLLSLVFAGIIIFSVQVATAQAAIADVTLKDVQTIVRTIGFLENKSDSESVMAIIYNPNSSESLHNARQMEKLIKAEKKNLRPRLVSVSNTAELQGANFAFIAGELQPHYNSIKAALNENKLLSFTLDRDCINQNCCAVYINSTNRVEIVVNKTVTDAIQAKFKTVFLMMVTVI